MGASCDDKLSLDLAGKPVMLLSIERFLQCEFIEKVVIVVRSDEQKAKIKELVLSTKIEFVQGGGSRTESVFNALKFLSENDCRYVVIHDCARPFVTEKQIVDVCSACHISGAAILAKKTTDTIVSNDDSFTYLDRNKLWNIETPQAFKFDLIFAGYKNAIEKTLVLTDDSCAIAAAHNVDLIENKDVSLKITCQADIEIARGIFKNRMEHFFENSIRVGCGYDIHQLVAGRKLIIGGVDIPFEKGLLGHSDADVLVHAICDAMLGAAALPDIGQNFPDTDSRYAGISSMSILREVVKMVTKNGYFVGNIDSIIIAQSPTMAPHIDAMRANIASALGCDVSCVSIKAKTNNGLDSVGFGAAMSAHANVLLVKR